jgi:predicted DNA-binding protein YlxM (UPF0122 family)
MDNVQMLLLFDYYGELLTERQRMCFDLKYNQDLSLAEIAQELGVSRQGVFDNITRAEAHLVNMEEKTGCVRRLLQTRRAVEEISEIASSLRNHYDPRVRDAVKRMEAAVKAIEE